VGRRAVAVLMAEVFPKTGRWTWLQTEGARTGYREIDRLQQDKCRGNASSMPAACPNLGPSLSAGLLPPSEDGLSGLHDAILRAMQISAESADGANRADSPGYVGQCSAGGQGRLSRRASGLLATRRPPCQRQPWDQHTK